MRAHRLPPAVALFALLALTACGAGAADPAATAGETQAPAVATTPASPEPATPSPEATPPGNVPETASPAGEATTAGVEAVSVYYVRSGATQFWVEPVEVPLDEPTLAVARAALEALFTREPEDPNLVRPTDADVEVLGADVSDGLLTVDVSSALADASGGSGAEIALGQAIAHTGAQFDTVDAVQLHVDGQPVTDLWGHLDWSQPVEPDEFAVSPIVITSPRWDEQLASGPVTASGTANVFEANVTLRLLGPDAEVVEETFTTATCGSGCRGDWEHTFDAELTPGRWTIEAEEPDPSGGEGREPFVTSVVFEVG